MLNKGLMIHFKQCRFFRSAVRLIIAINDKMCL